MKKPTIDKAELMSQLAEELGIKNPMAIPRLKKIVLNAGLGEALTDNKIYDRAAYQISLITGQKPYPTRAKRAIASYKLRAGEVIGVKVTLRGKRMEDFFAKLVRIVLPRIRDFRGVSTSGFDGRGNYSLGLFEMSVFPEIDYTKLEKIKGMEISIITSAGDDKQSLVLLTKLGMPFAKAEKNG